MEEIPFLHTQPGLKKAVGVERTDPDEIFFRVSPDESSDPGRKGVECPLSPECVNSTILSPVGSGAVFPTPPDAENTLQTTSACEPVPYTEPKVYPPKLQVFSAPLVVRALNDFYDPNNSILCWRTKYEPVHDIFQERFGNAFAQGESVGEPNWDSMFSFDCFTKRLLHLNIPEEGHSDEHEHYYVLSDQLWEGVHVDSCNWESEIIHKSTANHLLQDSNQLSHDEQFQASKNSEAVMRVPFYSRTITCNQHKVQELETNELFDNYTQKDADSKFDSYQSYWPFWKELEMEDLDRKDVTPSCRKIENVLDSGDEDIKQPRFLRTVIDQLQHSRLIIKEKECTKRSTDNSEASNSTVQFTGKDNANEGKDNANEGKDNANDGVSEDDWSEDCLDFEPFSP